MLFTLGVTLKQNILIDCFFNSKRKGPLKLGIESETSGEVLETYCNIVVRKYPHPKQELFLKII